LLSTLWAASVQTLSGYRFLEGKGEGSHIQ
jgi:hypothetical protein